jgi:hypothetical protein
MPNPNKTMLRRFIGRKSSKENTFAQFIHAGNNLLQPGAALFPSPPSDNRLIGSAEGDNGAGEDVPTDFPLPAPPLID